MGVTKLLKSPNLKNFGFYLIFVQIVCFVSCLQENMAMVEIFLTCKYVDMVLNVDLIIFN